MSGGVRVVKNIRIPMRDGIELAADLYLPDAVPSVPLPAVVEYIPYRKDEVVLESDYYAYLPRHDYVVVRVDIRGTGASGGVSVDEYTEQEQLDGYDAIEWIAAQPFCDGQVSMIGNSYGGFTALQVATRRPPHLTSVVPLFFTDDRYTDDCHYRGGLMRKYFDAAGYGVQMVAWNALPPTLEHIDADWARIWEEHLEHNEPYMLKWLEHQTDEPYWREGSVGDIADRIDCPVFMIGGWRDGYPNPPLRLYEKLICPKKVLIGPWNHAMPDVAIPGPRIDYLHEVVRWLDHWCKGRGTGIMDEAAVSLYMQHPQQPVPDLLDTTGEWRAETDWPPPGLGERTLYLGDHGSLVDEPGAPGSDSYPYIATVGVTGGLWSGGLPIGLPGDQRPDEALSLVYTSTELPDDVHIVGRPHAILHVSSTASVMGFCVSLSDVAADGTSQLVAKGMLNGTRRASLSAPEPLAPGEVYELHIPIDATAWRFPKGHRLRLTVASADWPNVWPTPEPGVNSVHCGLEHASCVRLPTVPREGTATPIHYLPAPRSRQHPSHDPRPPRWEVTRDLLTDRTTVTVECHVKQEIDDTKAVERRYWGVSEVDPADPAHATQRGQHVTRLSVPGGLVESASNIVIQGTASTFDVTLDVTVSIDGVQRFAKSWVESFPRALL